MKSDSRHEGLWQVLLAATTPTSRRARTMESRLSSSAFWRRNGTAAGPSANEALLKFASLSIKLVSRPFCGAARRGNVDGEIFISSRLRPAHELSSALLRGHALGVVVPLCACAKVRARAPPVCAVAAHLHENGVVGAAAPATP